MCRVCVCASCVCVCLSVHVCVPYLPYSSQVYSDTQTPREPSVWSQSRRVSVRTRVWPWEGAWHAAWGGCGGPCRTGSCRTLDTGSRRAGACHTLVGGCNFILYILY